MPGYPQQNPRWLWKNPIMKWRDLKKKIYYNDTLTYYLREGVIKSYPLVADISVNGRGGGGGLGNPLSATFEKKNCFYFFLKREKDAECSETEKYVFC